MLRRRMERARPVGIVLLFITMSFTAVTIIPEKARATPSWVSEVVDSSGDVGWANSLATDSLGNPHIAYYDHTMDLLKHAYWNGLSWTSEEVDSGTSGPYCSLALDSLDRPHITYIMGHGGGSLKYTYWNGASWVMPSIPAIGGIAHVTLALSDSDLPHIAFYDALSGDLRHAYWDGSSWDITTVDWYGLVGVAPSIALDSLGNPHISYVNHSDRGLKYAHWDGLQWMVETVDASVSLQEFQTSLGLDSSDSPHIAYADTETYVRYARWDGFAWQFEKIAYVGFSGATIPDLALDSLDFPRIAYVNATTSAIMYARWDGSQWIREIMVPHPIGLFHSLELDSIDDTKLSFYDSVNGDLRFAYWGDDVIYPVSSVIPVSPYFWNRPIMVSATATDSQSGVISVTLWYRYSMDNSTWTPWVEFDTDGEFGWGWSFTFPEGEGHYEFLSQAMDLAGNVEPMHGSADAGTAFDATSPSSSLDGVGEFWQDFSVNLSAQVYDSFSGIRNVSLVYKHSYDNLTWGPSTLFSDCVNPPWEWNFTFPYGDGYYQLHTLAWDRAGNNESPPPTFDVEVARDITAPMSIVIPIGRYWVTEDTELNAIALDETSGLRNVSLLYRFSDDNLTWGSWTFFESKENSPWTWNFTFPYGNGYYGVCSQAIDNRSNIEPICSFPHLEIARIPGIVSPPTNATASLSGPGSRDVNISWGLSADDADVDHYEIYYHTAFSSDPTGYTYLAEVPRGTDHFIHEGAGEGNPSNFFYYVVAIGNMNVSSDPSNQAGKFTRYVDAGPQLLSFPLLQADESIQTVFQTLVWDKAWSYDSPSHEWKWFTTFKGYGRGLWSINHTMGVWVNVIDDSNLTVAGVVPARTTIHLYEGWNLISFPSFNSSYTIADLKAATGATRVEGYDPAPPYFLRWLGDSEVLQAGYGYWVMVTTAHDWIVEAS